MLARTGIALIASIAFGAIVQGCTSRSVSGPAPVVEGTVTSRPQAFVLRGRVLDEVGAPVRGASVLIEENPARSIEDQLVDVPRYKQVFATLGTRLDGLRHRVGQAVTDLDGMFEIPVDAEGPYDVRLEALGFGPTLSAPVWAGGTRRFELARNGRVRGVVVDEAGEPMARAWVVVTRRGLVPYEVGQWTDTRGRCVFENVPAGDLWLWTICAGNASRESRGVRLQPGGEIEVVFETLKTDDRMPLTIEGIVRDRETRAPIAGAEVSLSGVPTPLATTDEQGSFRVETHRSSRGYVSLESRALGRARVVRGMDVVRDGGKRIEFDMPRAEGRELAERYPRSSIYEWKGQDWHGAVVDESGAPLSGAFVWSECWHVGTDTTSRIFSAATVGPNGHFVLPNVPRDHVQTVFATARGRGVQRRVVLVNDTKETSLDLGVFTLPPARRIQGTLLDSEGSPSAGVKVKVESWHPDEIPRRDYGRDAGGPVAYELSSTSDEAGHFVLTGLSSGRWKLFVGLEARRAAELEFFDITPDRDPPPFEIRLDSSWIVEGHAVDERGRPIESGDVILESKHATPQSMELDGQGRFRFEGLAPGIYSVRITTEAHEGEAYRVFAGATDVVVTCRKR